MTVADTDLGWKRIQRELRRADGSFVTVGIHDDAGMADGGLTTAQVGAFHEFGTRTVPQRAFLRPTMDARQNELSNMLVRGYDDVVLAGRGTVQQVLALVGTKAQEAIQQTIREGRSEWPPLDPRTVARKGSSKPLIDTGNLIQSIRYKVVIREGLGG